MTLRQAQAQFAVKLSDLIRRAEYLGFEVTLGEAHRPPDIAELYAKQGRGIVHSAHTMRLAIDLNLFRDGKYITSTDGHRQLGEWWESIGGIWGGSFQRKDGNHYEWPKGGVSA